MEHRTGIEPVNTGFAGAKYAVFSVAYWNRRPLNGVERKGREFIQWWKNGGAPKCEITHRIVLLNEGSASTQLNSLATDKMSLA